MAPRRRCRNRIRSVCCLSEASCRRFPISVPAAWGPRAAGRHLRGRLLLPTSLGETREVGRLPGRDPAWSSGRTSRIASPASRAWPRSRLCRGFAARQDARRHCSACWTGKAQQISLPWGVAGNSARRPTRFLLRQKVGQKGGPYDGAPLRGVHAPQGTETGSVGNSLRSDSRRFFIRFSPWRRVAV